MPYAYGNYGNTWTNWQWGGGTSAAPAKTVTPEEERKAKREKARENYLKLFEIDKQIEQAEKAKTKNDNILKIGKNGIISADGIIRLRETLADYKKLPFLKKALRFVGGFVQGGWKLATGLVGYETDKKTGETKWNCTKLLTNVGIAFASWGMTLIPYVGPFIKIGMLCLGAGIGAFQAGKGICNLLNPKSVEDIDKSAQDIGEGWLTAATSVLGLKGSGGVSASASKGGFWSSVKSMFNVKSFWKDVTVNACKNAKYAAKRDVVNVRTKGFWKTWGGNIKNSIPKLGKTKFLNGRKDLNKQFDNKVDEITARIDKIRTDELPRARQTNNRTAYEALKDEFMLLRHERQSLLAQKAELNNATTQSGFANLKINSKAHQEAKFWQEAASTLEKDGVVEIPSPSGGTYKIKLNADKSNIKMLKQMAKRANESARQMEEFVKLRRSTIQRMAFRKDMADEVQLYTGKDRSCRLGRLWDVYKPEKPKFTWSGFLTSPIKYAFMIMGLPFKPWNMIEKNAASSFFKAQEAIAPVYEKDMIVELLGDKLGMGDRVYTEEIDVQNEKGEVIRQQTPITTNLLTQLEAASKQYEETIAQLKDEKKKLTA